MVWERIKMDNKSWEKMYEAAKKVLNDRQISEYVSAGAVSAGPLRKSHDASPNVAVIAADKAAIFINKSFFISVKEPP